MTILLRALLALGIVLAGWALYVLINRLALRRLRKQELRLPAFSAGRPAVLYFTTPGCVPCKTMQQPALGELRTMVGDALQIIEVDASQQTATADYWGVLSVPTTFVIDSHGEPRSVNHGVATAKVLLDQLQAAEGRPLVGTSVGATTRSRHDYN